MTYICRALYTHLASALEEEGVVAELSLDDAHGGQHARDGHRRRALDVVVEGQVVAAVLLQQAEGVRVRKVLKLNQRV